VFSSKVLEKGLQSKGHGFHSPWRDAFYLFETFFILFYDLWRTCGLSMGIMADSEQAKC
jgi:hypothetical protein